MVNERHVYEFEIVRTVRLSSEDIDDIMCAALEGGITSNWCGSVEVVGKYLGEYAHEQISRNGKLKFNDMENGKIYTLDLAAFQRGFQKWTSSIDHLILIDDGIDTGNIDAYDADSIVQYALFGEVVFG